MKNVELDFSEVIDTIQSVDENLEYQTLVNLSDLDSSDMAALASSWKTIPENRRLELFEKLYRLGEEDTVLSFLEISRFALEAHDIVLALSCKQAKPIPWAFDLCKETLLFEGHIPDQEATYRPVLEEHFGEVEFLGMSRDHGPRPVFRCTR